MLPATAGGGFIPRHTEPGGLPSFTGFDLLNLWFHTYLDEGVSFFAFLTFTLVQRTIWGFGLTVDASVLVANLFTEPMSCDEHRATQPAHDLRNCPLRFLRNAAFGKKCSRTLVSTPTVSLKVLHITACVDAEASVSETRSASRPSQMAILWTLIDAECSHTHNPTRIKYRGRVKAHLIHP